MALEAMLLELRDWIEETHPGNLDGQLISICVEVCDRSRQELMRDGAR